MVGGGAAGAGRAQDQVELLADLFLADELLQVLGAQGGFDRGVLAVGVGPDQAVAGAIGGRRQIRGVGAVFPVHAVCLGSWSRWVVRVREPGPGGSGGSGAGPGRGARPLSGPG